MKLHRVNINPAISVSIGLLALIVGWLLLTNILFDIWPDQKTTLKDMRVRTSENLAIQSSALIQSGDFIGLKKTIEESVKQNSQIRSVAIRGVNGDLILQVGDHELYWKPISNMKSTIDYTRISIMANQQPWGTLEIAFDPTLAKSISSWFKQPIVISIALLIAGGFVLYTLYLHKVFNYLDPSSVIPDRVSAAFDNFTEGVMMIDQTGRIVLANKTLRNWVDEKNTKLFGKHIKDLPLLKSVLHDNPSNDPWFKAMDLQEPVNGLNLELVKENGGVIKVVINCSPIQDAANNTRGCLVTFDDITELDHINQELMKTMTELNHSQAEIERQNVELRKLATRDPLTNCLNRRSFFEDANIVFANAVSAKQPLSCIMTDIDHFKLFNDRYGHAIGDKVLVSVSRSLYSGLRPDDLLARYGGEEFCILLGNTPIEVALSIAERLREEIETQAGKSIRNSQELKVTSSFGVSTLKEDTTDLAALIDQADKALYVSKNNGRNCVTAWENNV